MDILRKIFSYFKTDKKVNSESNLATNQNESKVKNIELLNELENLIKPLIKDATKIEILSASKPPENSQLISQFGGDPYFENGAEWYKTKGGKNLDFIFQIFNNGEIQLPKSIKLIQFFYDLDESAWQTEDDGWFVKIYESLNIENVVKVENPTAFEEFNYCEISLIPVKSLPDWEGIDFYEKNAAKISEAINKDDEWDSYDEIVDKLIGEQDYQSQLGGYPRWVQGDNNPKLINGDNMKLLFQIDSDDNAGLMWGDVGLVYVFYDEITKKIEFELQCH